MVEACDHILETFKIDSLKDLHCRGLEALIKGQDVFIVQPTGSGKSLTFQSAPIVFDIWKPLQTGKSIVIVISPLVSLMEAYLLKSCFPATLPPEVARRTAIALMVG